MNSRIKKLVSGFRKVQVDALLITHNPNIHYLTKFPASESYLLVTKKQAYYVTDFRYILEAKKGLKGIPVVQYTQSPFQTVLELATKDRVKNLGFDDQYITLAQFRNLKKLCPKKIHLKTIHNLVEDLREVKDKSEMACIEKALEIHHKALKYLKTIIKPGVTERQVFLKLENFVKSRGVGFSFDPIVASGPNSCLPHASITDRKIKNNEPVLVDMGIDVDSYKSDLTRMFFLGKISALVQDVNNSVREAQHVAIKEIRAGVRIDYIDSLARNLLAQKQLAKYFGHALGHGVGLEIHENPRLSQKNSSLLREGMVITIEPAVYLPDKFGIRIEDMILVTKKGYKILSDNID